jgi:hypothetical protein
LQYSSLHLVADIAGTKWEDTIPVNPCAPLCVSLFDLFAMKSWRQDSVRFFATVFVVRYLLCKPLKDNV